MNSTAVKAFLRGAMQESPTDEQIQFLVGYLLKHSSQKWYRYSCVTPGCMGKIFASEELTECYCHGEKMEMEE